MNDLSIYKCAPKFLLPLYLVWQNENLSSMSLKYLLQYNQRFKDPEHLDAYHRTGIKEKKEQGLSPAHIVKIPVNPALIKGNKGFPPK